MGKRFGLTFVTVALGLVGFATPAAAQIGGGLSFLENAGSSMGFALNAAKDWRQQNEMLTWAPVGDFSFHSNNGHVTTFGGGLRANVHTKDTRFMPFGEVLAGISNIGCDGCDGDTAFQFTWGGGVHVPISPKWNILAQFDIITAMRDEATDNAFRMTFGISVPWH